MLLTARSSAALAAVAGAMARGADAFSGLGSNAADEADAAKQLLDVAAASGAAQLYCALTQGTENLAAVHAERGMLDAAARLLCSAVRFSMEP